MGNLVRMISGDGSVMACAINSTQIVAEIEKIHQTSAVVTAAIGRLSTAASIMGYSLKGENDTLTLRMNGNGATGSLIAVANSKGNVKAYVQNPVVELPLNQYGKLDVRGAVGSDGFLSVVKDLGLKEPYIGQVPIVSGEIAEDITSYFAVSEQTPTVCGLGVLVNPDLSVKAAGGYLIQLLPFADEKCIDTIEENINNIESVSTMIDNGLTPIEICELLLKGLSPNLLEDVTVSYRCDCSRDRIGRALISIGKKELLEMKDEQD
ncbi:MAG: Hsp33 family molecular chaperone HslO, partial [Oscillospiraceae bacterium]